MLGVNTPPNVPSVPCIGCGRVVDIAGEISGPAWFDLYGPKKLPNELPAAKPVGADAASGQPQSGSRAP